MDFPAIMLYFYIMKDSLDFIFGSEVQEILDTFSALFGIRIAFFSPSGEEMKTGAPHREPAGFCSYLREEMGLDKRCRATDITHRAKAKSQKRLHVYTCHAGLTEAIIPVYQEEMLVGHVMIGQFRVEGKGESQRRKLEKLCDKPKELRKRWDALPCFGTEESARILKMFDLLVRYINAQHMVKRQAPATIDPLLDYLREHIARPVTLGEIAAHAHRSESTISHLFRQQLGKRFKEVIIGIKLDHADHLLKTRPSLTIQEIAARVGYDDQLYFSRLYRKYRGHPPSAARK
ncbi:MAG: PocR ligand-binding domain-containing protein [Planctomycetes bacterium]|nr:PocR ligand-binding domain-containing protein [Planctomycetota bacterium]